MNNYDFDSKKYIALLVIVLVIFLILVIKAFDYLPEQMSGNENAKDYIARNINSPGHVKLVKEVQEEHNKDSDDGEKHKHGHFDFMPKTEQSSEKIEEFPAPKGINEDNIQPSNTAGNQDNTNGSPEEKALKCIINAQNFKSNSDDSNALSELQKVEDLTNDNELRAMSYEKIAELYAANRKFGTALAFANKAQNISPTTARQMLIARIYYQAGNTDVAISRLNNLLKQGF